MGEQGLPHAALMDATYRHQRRFYNATRRHYLLGRDRLIDDLEPPEGGRVLEVACGTGRNLARISRQYPGRALYGLDISEEMLRSARAALGNRARLSAGDACRFEAETMFGVAGFDRIVLSYALSMIPDWPAALETAARQLAPDGRLHVVDFGDQAGLPEWFDRGLRAWLRKFHVTPRDELQRVAGEIAARTGCGMAWQPLHRGYAQYAVLARVAGTGDKSVTAV